MDAILISEKKKQVRELMRKRLERLSEADLKAGSSSICAQIQEHLLQCGETEGMVVTSFAAFGAEPDLLDLHRLLPQLCLAYPRCRGGGQMDFYHVDNPADLVAGSYGILEPKEGCQRLNVADVDVFLVPALAYNLEGERLGKGGGYYDRILERASEKALKLGVIFSCQLNEFIPTDQHDQTVDAIIHPAMT